jgi:hypothetical protein
MNYTPQEITLATEFANKLDDRESMPFHLSSIRHYEEWSLRKQLKKVMSIPADKIRVSRGAYYNTLVQRHGVPKNPRPKY